MVKIEKHKATFVLAAAVKAAEAANDYIRKYGRRLVKNEEMDPAMLSLVDCVSALPVQAREAIRRGKGVEIIEDGPDSVHLTG